MKLSKRGEYALRALIDPGVAQELGRPLLSLGELSDKEQIPATFWEQILFQLRSAGYVASNPSAQWQSRSHQRQIEKVTTTVSSYATTTKPPSLD